MYLKLNTDYLEKYVKPHEYEHIEPFVETAHKILHSKVQKRGGRGKDSSVHRCVWYTGTIFCHRRYRSQTAQLHNN